MKLVDHFLCPGRVNTHADPSGSADNILARTPQRLDQGSLDFRATPSRLLVDRIMIRRQNQYRISPGRQLRVADIRQPHCQ